MYWGFFMRILRYLLKQNRNRSRIIIFVLLTFDSSSSKALSNFLLFWGSSNDQTLCRIGDLQAPIKTKIRTESTLCFIMDNYSSVQLVNWSEKLCDEYVCVCVWVTVLLSDRRREMRAALWKLLVQDHYPGRLEHHGDAKQQRLWFEWQKHKATCLQNSTNGSTFAYQAKHHRKGRENKEQTISFAKKKIARLPVNPVCVFP